MEAANRNASKSSATFFDLINNPVKFRLLLLKNLPAAYFSGLKIINANQERSVVSIPYKWFTRNPFRCTYFACLSMAAEMSTGILSMANTYKRSPKISMLVTGIEGQFYKRATGLSVFICEEGDAIRQVVEQIIRTNQAQSIKVLSSGFNKQNELIAEFRITWSFKIKS
ncbi:MAG TPA: hypothetical protein VNT20_13300 [Flavisolibacter sp.]|jgi:hypothetical protein|nr:hypothetical protein [Flavisolibacter sp.]